MGVAKMTLRMALFAALTAADSPTQVEELLAKQAQLEARISEMHQAFLNMEASQARQLKEAATITQGRELTAVNQGIADSLDYMWLLVCGALVMFMQAGFAILEAGSCRAKNGGMVLTKNVFDACGGTLVWYLVGYGLAYGSMDGDDSNKFIGTGRFAGQFDAPSHYRDWFFQWAFCATAATIVSGAVAERINFIGYAIYSVVMTGLIYPVVVYWTWSGHGFLTKEGYSDFAGSGIVHLTGGISALVGAIVLGARDNRWNSKDEHRFDPHNMGLVVLGTFILWFGWYGFNCGSTLSFHTKDVAEQGALVAMNTTIAAAMGGLSVFALRLRHKKIDLAGICNGILVGLVAVCAGVGDVEPHACLLIGFCGALGYEAASVSLKRLKIDDPLDAFAVHGCGGIVGALLRPLLDKRGASGMDEPTMGKMFGAHCLAVVVIIAWAGGISFLTFYGLKLAGVLRKEEVKGADSAELCHQMYRDHSFKENSVEVEDNKPQKDEDNKPPKDDSV